LLEQRSREVSARKPECTEKGMHCTATGGGTRVLPPFHRATARSGLLQAGSNVLIPQAFPEHVPVSGWVLGIEEKKENACTNSTKSPTFQLGDGCAIKSLYS
jgi:hypothetical protein